jgi:hypothetical protein
MRVAPEPDVLDLVAEVAEVVDPRQLLDVPLIVVFPELMS